MQAKIDGITYEITMTQVGETIPNLSAHLVANGWDGNVYEGVSKPAGRQRKEYRQMFFRRAKTGSFESVV